MELRNCILIALAFDATPAEVEAAHDAIDKQFVGATPGSVDPRILVTAQVSGTTGDINTSGTGQPVAAAPHVATIATDVVLDASNLPWDERIHSSNHKFNDKGLWWAKRGVTPALKAKVESELRSTLGAVADRREHDVVTAIAPPALPGAGLPPMPGAAVLPDPYTDLVQFIAQNTSSPANPAGKFTDDYIKQVLTHYGVADGNLQNLAHAPQLIPTISEWLHSVLKA